MEVRFQRGRGRRDTGRREREREVRLYSVDRWLWFFSPDLRTWLGSTDGPAKRGSWLRMVFIPGHLDLDLFSLPFPGVAAEVSPLPIGYPGVGVLPRRASSWITVETATTKGMMRRG